VDIYNLWLQVLFSLFTGYCLNKYSVYENTYDSIHGCLMKTWLIFLSLIVTKNFLNLYLIEIIILIILSVISILLKVKRNKRFC